MTNILRALVVITMLSLSLASGLKEPFISLTYGEQMRLDLEKSNITLRQDGTYDVLFTVQHDNNDSSLPEGFRRWWHAEINSLVGGEILNFYVTDLMYSDIILPVWSLDRKTEYKRCPESATPIFDGVKTHKFTLQVPIGTNSFRIAKFFPFTLEMYQKLRRSVISNNLVKESIIGQSRNKQDIHVWEISKPEVEAKQGVPRIYIQAGIHPSETTSFFMLEGFFNWLLSSSSPESQKLLDMAVLSVVPMTNPDGVALGNYRTNSFSENLEVQYSYPYNTQIPEDMAIQKLVEKYMGTSSNPGSHPIQVLLNLHSTHEDPYPYHFQHQPTYYINGTGVIPEVYELESLWISCFQKRSAYVSKGVTLYSYLNPRQYIESMVHDRWSLDDNYKFPKVMAITFEGTYQFGPNGCCSSQDDYRQVGVDMGLALLDYMQTVNQK